MENTLGITVKREEDHGEWYSQLVTKSGLADYSPVSGCMIIQPKAYFIWETVQHFFDQLIKKSGVKNVYFPCFIPESLLQKEATHVEGFSAEVAWVTMGGNSPLGERLAVRPTSETIMYEAYARWIRSYRDLPLKYNQWCNVVRWEFNHPTLFLRTREFLWQEGHTVFATQEEADTEVLEILEFYRRTVEELLAVAVVLGKKSEGEKFAGALYSTSVETFLPSGKGVQVATSHCLGQNFAKAFNISFTDKDSQQKTAWQNSWGFSTRTIGAMTLMHSDEHGLVLPPRVADTQVVIVPILFDQTRDVVLKAAEKIATQLSCRYYLDDRNEHSTGFKFNEWELKGIPLRIEIGPKDVEKQCVIAVRRDTRKKESIPFDMVEKRIPELLEEIQTDMLARSRKFLEQNTVPVETLAQFVTVIQQKQAAKASWCGSNACADLIKEKAGAKCFTHPFDWKPKSTCFACGAPATAAGFFGKSY